jgi:hypothetical protein
VLLKPSIKPGEYLLFIPACPEKQPCSWAATVMLFDKTKRPGKGHAKSKIILDKDINM